MIIWIYLRQKNQSSTLSNVDKVKNESFGLKDREYEEFYLPCDEKESGAIKKSLNDIPSNQLLLREVDIVSTKNY